MKTTFKITGLFALGLSVTACSDAPYTPIVDGQKDALFQSDLAACRQVSLQHEKTNERAIGGAVIGGLIGGAEADNGDELGGVVAGAVIGGLLGSAEEGGEVSAAQDRIVFNCMRGRGHNVVG